MVKSIVVWNYGPTNATGSFAVYDYEDDASVIVSTMIDVWSKDYFSWAIVYL